MSSVSAYRQMQNWGAVQGYVTGKVLGGAKSANAVDSGIALASAANNTISSAGSRAAGAAITRIHQKTQAANARHGGPAVDGAAAAKTAGNAVLSSLGLNGADLAAAYRTSAPSSASGPYRPPTNPSTGHGFALTSGSALGAQSAVNLFA